MVEPMNDVYIVTCAECAGSGKLIKRLPSCAMACSLGDYTFQSVDCWRCFGKGKYPLGGGYFGKSEIRSK